MKGRMLSMVGFLVLWGCGTESGSDDVPDAQTDSGFDVQAPADILNFKDHVLALDTNMPDSCACDAPDMIDAQTEFGPPPDVQDTILDIQPDTPSEIEPLPDVPDFIHEVQPDIPEAPDVTDCGPALCVDCACQCPDGTWHEYGGCFDDCDEIPDEIKNCSMDCSKVCPDDVTGQPCNFQDCPDGYLCLAEPCTMCGIPPQPVCVPEPCPLDGCWFDWDCQNNQVCVGASFPFGPHGQCLPAVGPPECWEDVDCPGSSTCVGALHCPPCWACAMPWAPGHCEAGPDQGGVLLWVDGGYLITGSQVHPVWYNFTDGAVYLAGCTTYTIEQKGSGGAWLDLGPPAECFWEGYAVKVEPDGAHEAMTFQAVPKDLSEFGTFRLRGQYWTGCLDDQPISQAQCKGGPLDVLSKEFSVGPPPP